jgi:hypothetical protein
VSNFSWSEHTIKENQSQVLWTLMLYQTAIIEFVKSDYPIKSVFRFYLPRANPKFTKLTPHDNVKIHDMGVIR